MDKQLEQIDLDTIYRSHVHDLYSYALHLGFNPETCKDAIHDVFYKLCIDQIRLDQINNIRFYLLRALKNRLIDIYKQKKDISELSIDTIAEELPFTIRVTVEDEMIQSEENQKTKEAIENLLQSLSDRQREIIYLRYTHECEYEEIAQLMNISVNSCRNLLHKAILNLKKSPFPLSILLAFMG